MKKKNVKEEVLEGLQFEDISDNKEEIEVTQDMIDNAIVIDSKPSKKVTLEIEGTLKDAPEKTAQPSKDKPYEINSSRRIKLRKEIINTEFTDIPRFLIPDYNKLSEIIADYMKDGLAIEVIDILKRKDGIDRDSLKVELQSAIPAYMGKLAPLTINSFSAFVEDLLGDTTVVMNVKPNGAATIGIVLEGKILYKQWPKIYLFTKIVEIPV